MPLNTLMAIGAASPILFVAANAFAQDRIPHWKNLPKSKLPECEDLETICQRKFRYLSFNGYCCRVPGDSILHLPEPLVHRVVTLPEGRQISWLAFLTRNRAWLTQQDVDWEIVTGKKIIPESRRSHFVQSSQIVVATYQGGPITVLPPIETAAN